MTSEHERDPAGDNVKKRSALSGSVRKWTLMETGEWPVRDILMACDLCWYAQRVRDRAWLKQKGPRKCMCEYCPLVEVGQECDKEGTYFNQIRVALALEFGPGVMNLRGTVNELKNTELKQLILENSRKFASVLRSMEDAEAKLIQETV